jgi:hypothetical protein
LAVAGSWERSLLVCAVIRFPDWGRHVFSREYYLKVKELAGDPRLCSMTYDSNSVRRFTAACYSYSHSTGSHSLTT